MKEVGLTPPAATSKSFVVMGKTFDPAKPEEYIKSFAIKQRRDDACRASIVVSRGDAHDRVSLRSARGGRLGR